MGVEILGVTIPTPYLCVLALYALLTILIMDGGGGIPVFWPLLRPFMRPFQPRPHYARLKSKYLVES